MNIDKHLLIVSKWFKDAQSDNQPLNLQLDNLNEELVEYLIAENDIEKFDAILDIYWVMLGIIKTLIQECEDKGFDFEGGFEEVARSNFSKFKVNEKGEIEVLKREDGKIMKNPDTYFPPNLTPYIKDESSECQE